MCSSWKGGLCINGVTQPVGTVWEKQKITPPKPTNKQDPDTSQHSSQLPCMQTAQKNSPACGSPISCYMWVLVTHPAPARGQISVPGLVEPLGAGEESWGQRWSSPVAVSTAGVCSQLTNPKHFWAEIAFGWERGWALQHGVMLQVPAPLVLLQDLAWAPLQPHEQCLP